MKHVPTRFKCEADAEWAGVQWKKPRAETKWLAEPRHCFNRARVDPDERLTRDLLWKCTSWFVDADGNGKPELPELPPIYSDSDSD